MVPEALQTTAFYLAFIMDIVLLLVLLAILIFVLVLYKKVTKAINSVNRIIGDTEDIVATVSHSIVRPASAGSGVAFGLGKAVAFLRGSRRRR